MAFRKILVPVIGGERDEAVLTAALDVAKIFGGHVLALYVRPDASEVLPYLGEGVSSGVVQDILDAAMEAAKKASGHAHAALTRAAAHSGVAVQDQPRPFGGASASFRSVQGILSDAIYEEALLSDVAVFDGPMQIDQPGIRDALETVLLTARRPVMVMPRERWSPLGAKAAIGWDGGLAAAQAVSHALPWLTRARAVEILQVRSGPIDPAEMDRLRDYLRLNGVDAIEHGVQSGDVGTGNALADAAKRCGADLLIMGGYGHSRLREWVLGGVTRHILSNVIMPVFLAH